MMTTQELPGGSQAMGPELRIWDGQDSLSREQVLNMPSAAVIWALRILCATALCVSGYLAYVGLTGEKIVGCGGGVWDCDHVTNTRWGKWFGMPVGLGACGMYAVCCVSLAFTNAKTPSVRNAIWSLLTVAGISAGLAGIWFISLQVLVIGHLCKWCLVAHGCGLGVAGLILWNRPAAQLTTRLALVGVLGVSVLVGGQLIHKPDTFVIIEQPPVDPGTPGPEAASGLILPPGAEDDGSLFTPPGMDSEGSEFLAPPIPESEFAPPPIPEE